MYKPNEECKMFMLPSQTVLRVDFLFIYFLPSRGNVLA